MLRLNSQKILPVFFLGLTALLLSIPNLLDIAHYPLFFGDSGFRLEHAGQIIVTYSNRVWLPFLQMHLWMLYKCGAPYWAFKLIPAFYSLIAVLFLGLLLYRMLCTTTWGLLFSILLMFHFSFHPLVKLVSINLFQEIVETALLYILLYGGMLNLEKKWSLLIVATLALLTRESSFVYLLAISVINHKKILSDAKYIYSFLWLWSIPAAWISLYLFKWGHFSTWPWIVNADADAAKEHFTGLPGLLHALQSNGVYVFAVAMAGVLLLITLCSNRNKNVGPKQGCFEADFMIFSLFSLAVIYMLIILFDPWQATYGNNRMVMPLLGHMFIWAGILYKKIDECPGKLQIFLRIVIISSLILVGFGQKRWKAHKYHDEKVRFCHSIQYIKEKYYPHSKPMVCIIAKNYWDIGGTSFSAPTLYMDRKYIPPEDAVLAGKDACGIVIAPSQLLFEYPGFTRYDTFKVNTRPDQYVPKNPGALYEISYTVYLKN